MIHGYRNEDGVKEDPTLKGSAEYYNVSYGSLKQHARNWNWKEKRKDYKLQVDRKVAQKKRSEKLSESEAEEIVVEAFKFNKTANKLRRALDNELDKIIEGKVELYSLKDGTPVLGTPRNAAYLLMNVGKGLESAQKVSLTAKGEPSEISKVEANVEYNESLLSDPDYIAAKRKAMDEYYVDRRNKE
jgi:hypothetical protein